jgi:2-polyprenyl-3-methyl-5-hydroxy-6-metoxy-1,4-benzoquinol methylase
MSQHAQAQSENVRRFFSDFSGQWDTIYGGKRTRLLRTFDAMFRRDIYDRYDLTFKTLGPLLNGKSVLDIGCGSGVYCFEAARWAPRKIVGLDIAEPMITLAREEASRRGLAEQCRFVCSSFPTVRRIPELEEPFDFAIVMGVLDYVAEPVVFLSALREHIRGSAVISVPFKDSWRWPLRRIRYRLLGRCEVFHHSEAETRDYLARAGFARFDVRHLDYTGGCYFVTAFA